MTKPNFHDCNIPKNCQMKFEFDMLLDPDNSDFIQLNYNQYLEFKIRTENENIIRNNKFNRCI